jgi:hypothetical protein
MIVSISVATKANPDAAVRQEGFMGGIVAAFEMIIFDLKKEGAPGNPDAPGLVTSGRVNNFQTEEFTTDTHWLVQ